MFLSKAGCSHFPSRVEWASLSCCSEAPRSAGPCTLSHSHQELPGPPVHWPGPAGPKTTSPTGVPGARQVEGARLQAVSCQLGSEAGTQRGLGQSGEMGQQGGPQAPPGQSPMDLTSFHTCSAWNEGAMWPQWGGTTEIVPPNVILLARPRAS